MSIQDDCILLTFISLRQAQETPNGVKLKTFFCILIQNHYPDKSDSIY